MYRNILVATDGSELAGRGVEQAVALAAALRAALVVVTVSEPWSAALADPTGLTTSGELLDDYRAGAQAQAERILAAAQAAAAVHEVSASVVYVPEREPADAILETAATHGCDLLVMASHGRRGLGRLLLGSQTQSVITRSGVPVLVVR